MNAPLALWDCLIEVANVISYDIFWRSVKGFDLWGSKIPISH